MDSEEYIASTTTELNVAPEKVWEALTSPEMIKQYMFGAEAVSDWKKGSSLIYKGEWEGKSYEDKGTILEIEPNKLLKTTYYSPMSGLEDVPENYNTVSYILAPNSSNGTILTVTQTNNKSEEAARRAEENWKMVLGKLKELLA